MRLLLGLTLMLIGGGIMLYGMYLALRQLIGLYQGALEDPMGDSDIAAGAEEPGEAVQQEMFRGLKIGAIGVVPFLIGVVLFKGEMARRLRRKLQRAGI